jgi:nitrite reductase/ring-hydroxylating ferredoxin subunit
VESVGRSWRPLDVPFAMESPDRARPQRYYDAEFFELEVERLWSRTWQMACRLEEIPQPGDFVEYEILDQSVIVVRSGASEVRAFHNSCRHRGVRFARGRGQCATGFNCPFHGWSYGLDGANIAVTRRRSFAESTVAPGTTDLAPVLCETWGGCAWINLDSTAPPLRHCIEPFATIMDGWKVESLRSEWWYACRLPVNWKLAESAFLEQYHVVETHPQLRNAGRYAMRRAPVDATEFIDSDIAYLRTMSDGMAGMVHRDDVAIAESLRGTPLPDEPVAAMAEWQRELNDAVVAWHRVRGHDVPDLNALEARGQAEPMGYCFPHYFVLPMYSSASSYRFRPLGPEETLMEIWSLTRTPQGEDGPRPAPPEVWECDDPRWPPIPAQDFSNLPRQQLGIHARGLEFLRFSDQLEGGVANFERTVDGFLAGLSHDELRTALRTINVNPLEQPIRDVGF